MFGRMTEPLYVVALDESERAGHVLDVAVGLAMLTRAKLLLVHAVGIPRTAPRLDLSPEELRKSLDETAAAHLETIAHRVPSDMHVERFVEDGVAADVVSRIAKERGATLVFCGTHTHLRPLERALGSTASRIVHESPCSVFVVR
jgi:nucleotide-binding universal stress UspA family protein